MSFGLNVTISGEKVILQGLQSIQKDLPQAVGSGLAKIAKGIHRAAMDFLNGEGAKGTYVTTASGKTRWKKRDIPVAAGGYPVPVRTGNLKRLLDWLAPGQSKQGGGKTYTAGPMEAVVFDSAEYADVIHEGKGSSKKFGRRAFITDGATAFMAGNKMVGIIDTEISADIKAKGL